ncbi:MAG: hypothetical protein KKA61_00645 [Nanoarchaeota archaeon]|nr:hypothetical protein [Nanoarchaeota archaeon]
MIEEESKGNVNKTLKSEEVKEESDKNSSRNIIIAVIVILGLIILFFSIKYLYHPKTNEDSYVYNGFKFTKVSNLWFTEVQINNKLFRISMRYSPRELEHIGVEPGIYEKIVSSKKIYFTVPGNLSSVAVLAITELGRIVGTRYGILNIPSQSALTEGNGTLVKTCKDAVNDTGVILFKTGNTTAVYSDKNCVIVQGVEEWEIVKAADRVTFGLLGIMP